ncbi:MAG: replicative DNA helicase [Dehalococcoidia bacterium]|nr:replicative DNA helicase [Dehalococcoidia bacterium]MDD5493256.1 replicative DNA helicase [Dehalococcoidia bacterium]
MNEALPPYDLDAEEAVLGSLLIDSEAINEIDTILRTEDFFTEQNQLVYGCCHNLFLRDEAINQITVAQELARLGKLDEAGGVAYFSHLISIVPTSLHVRHYAQIVTRLAVMRRLISAAGQIEAIGYKAEPDVDLALSRAEDIIFKLRTRQGKGDFVSIHDALNIYFEEADKNVHEKELASIKTGFTAVDNALGGLQRSELIILAARTSIGKTSMALNIARNAAVNQKACVAIFSLEMSRREVIQRILSSEANIKSEHFKKERFSELEERMLHRDIIPRLAETSIFIDDTPNMRISEIRSKAKRLHLKRKIDLLVLDYIQLLRGDTRSDNRVQELTEITQLLKAISRELDAPVLALSQLSRNIEHRQESKKQKQQVKPQLSDLRDSGSIEQDADVVMFIHRPEKIYSEEDWLREFGEEKPYPSGIAEIIIAKNRNGPTGEVQLRFIQETTKFENNIVEVSTGYQ